MKPEQQSTSEIWLARLRHYLIEPLRDPAATHPDEWRQAMFVTSLLLVFIVCVVVLNLVFYVTDPVTYSAATPLGRIREVTLIALAGLYGLSRNRGHRFAVYAMLVLISAVVFAIFLARPSPAEIYQLNFLIIPQVVSFLFLTTQQTVLFSALCLGGIALLPVITPEVTFADILTRSLSFMGPLFATLIVTTLYVRRTSTAQTDALQKREERYRMLVEQAADGIVISSEEGRILEVNQAFCTMMGYPLSEIRDRTLRAYICPEDLAATPLRQAELNLGQVVIQVRHFRRKDGSTLVGEVSAKRLPDGGYLSIVRDLTERRGLEQARLDSEDFFRSIIENSSDAVFLTDADDHVIYAGPTMERLFGVSEKLVLHHLRYQFVHPDDVERLKASVAQAKTEPGQRVRVEYRRQHADGNWLWVESIITNMLQVPSVRALVINLRDITERKLAEAKLSASEARYRAVFEQSPMGIIEIRLDGRIMRGNPKLLSILDYRLEEIQGLSIDRLLRPTDLQDALPQIRKLIIGRIASIAGELELYRRDGSLIWASVTVGLVSSTGSGPEYLLALVNDSTARKAAEAELERSRHALEELNVQLEDRVQRRTEELRAAIKELESFSYSISHDLRAPLRVIDGYSRIFQRDFGAQLPPEAQQRLQAIRSETQRMGTLIHDLLNFSRLNRQVMRNEVVDMRALTAGVIDDLRAEREGRSIEITVTDLPATTGDPAMLRQVLMNLIANAIKFTRRRAVAHITIGHQPAAPDRHGETVYFVRDDGVGFDMAYANKLFGVFQRLHTSQEFEGTGVGLAIVQNIVQRHGGRVWAEAAPDQGATFYFSVAPGALTAPAPAPESAR